MAKFQYAPSPESRAIVTIRPSYGLFIGGEFVEAADGSTFETINPASEEVLAEVTQAGEGDTDRAVNAARQAFEGPWGRLS
ncbi:MAG TPA: aldehyde dehydrogenase family protein, partial [Dermatophilaceae bacterium]